LPEDRGAAGLRQALLRLQTTATVLHVTAHPDDEDAALLTALARGQGVRVLLLSLTRGEGGANLISSDFFDALGVLRTLEMLEVDRRYGAEQFFTRAVDYGFSKNLAEALDRWGGEEEVLRDAVRVVRRERPDVIVARFRGDASAGHGHHVLSGVIAERVFAAAADPGRFPEQLAGGLAAWQARKLYAPASRSNPAEAATVSVATGDYDPLLGRSYAQIAREAYGFHRSQGMSGRAARAGAQETAYRLARAADPSYTPAREASLFAGIDTRIEGLAARAGEDPPSWLTSGLGEVASAARQALDVFDARALDSCAPPLAKGLAAARRLIRDVEASAIPADARNEVLRHLRRKESEFEEAIARALALDLEALLELEGGPGPSPGGPGIASHTVSPGESVEVAVRLVNRNRIEARPVAVSLRAPAGWHVAPETLDLKPLGYNQALAARFAVRVAGDASPTRPHWRRVSVRETFYAVKPPELDTYPLPPPPLHAAVQVAVLGETITRVEPVRAEFQDPIHGRVREPVAVTPAVGIEFASEHGFLPLGERRYTVGVKVRSGSRRPVEGDVRLQLPAGWTADPESRRFTFAREGEELAAEFTLTAPGDLRAAEHVVTAVAAARDREYAEGFTLITARDLGRFHLYRPARHAIHAVDLKVAPDLRLAYVMGSGDEVPAAMAYLNARPDLLGPEALAGADLSPYDAILIGIRAYAVRPELKTQNARLLDYVKEGGVLIVQYQTPEFDQNYGPYPYTMTWGAEEVSEEDSPVEVLAPEHPLFTTPNRITPADFSGWVEQRGSKFWKTWDPRYVPLLASRDRNQEPQQGGMLFARHGKGAYVYSAYAWYRQLPFGVPGAARIFANLISLRRTLGEAPAAEK
jgi:LmbE family N-acetylglucosaminyl deacetylase